MVIIIIVHYDSAKFVTILFLKFNLQKKKICENTNINDQATLTESRDSLAQP